MNMRERYPGAWTVRPQQRRRGAAIAAAISLLTLCAIAFAGPAMMRAQPAVAEQAGDAIDMGAPPETAAQTAMAAPTSARAFAAETDWTTPPTIQRGGAPLQCAIYARQRSGLELSGAARSWWDGAAGRYQRANRPSAGAVLAMGGTARGHVAVVSRVLNAREILIDHANWMGEGEVQIGALARDVSPHNDWSEIVVWHAPSNGLGVRAYPVFGFILPQAA